MLIFDSNRWHVPKHGIHRFGAIRSGTQINHHLHVLEVRAL